ncbi:MAG: thermonuclease family protein [Acidobacteriota bacterium]
MRKLSFLIFIVGICAISIGAQASLTGTVAEVLDGRTIVLETSAGRVAAQLQYVEVPEQGQPLFSSTKAHLANLARGKVVELKTQRIVSGKAIGWVTIDGVDLSLQMIRDGAAWHEPKDTSGQSQDEAAEYEANEALAKREKRGVWSGAAIKTPWQVRAEKTRTQTALEIAHRISHPTPVGVGEFHSDTRRPSGQYAPAKGASVVSQRTQMDAWVNVFAQSSKEPYGLLTYSDPNGRFTGVYTSASLIDFTSPSGKEKLECRTMLVAPTRNMGPRGKSYLIGFRAISSAYRFSKGKSKLTVLADKQPMSLGVPFGYQSRGLIGAEEVMYYRVTWTQLRKIGNAKRVEFRIDTLTGPLSDDSRELIKQLVEATG